jgi:branched-chain amino acid aminotransferase
MTTWFQGQIVSGSLPISAFDRGLTLGDGLFETLLVHEGCALWQHEHLLRFKTSADELGMTYPEVEIAASIAALCRAARGHHVLRLTLTRGSAGRGLASDTSDFTYFASLQPFDTQLMFQPVDLMMFASIRRNETSPATRLKTTSYMDQILAARKATQAGFDDGLMLNSQGNIACSTIGNVFLIEGNRLITPSLDQGILPGIMRGVLMVAAAQAGFNVEERAIPSSEGKQADGLFTTNSLRFIRPAKRYGEHNYDALMELLCAAAKAQTGIDPRNI